MSNLNTGDINSLYLVLLQYPSMIWYFPLFSMQIMIWYFPLIFPCRSALKLLKIERVKQYDYCLPCEFVHIFVTFLMFLYLNVRVMRVLIYTFKRLYLYSVALSTTNLYVISACKGYLAQIWWNVRNFFITFVWYFPN